MRLRENVRRHSAPVSLNSLSLEVNLLRHLFAPLLEVYIGPIIAGLGVGPALRLVGVIRVRVAAVRELCVHKAFGFLAEGAMVGV